MAINTPIRPTTYISASNKVSKLNPIFFSLIFSRIFTYFEPIVQQSWLKLKLQGNRNDRCDFTSFSMVLQSYQNDGQVIIKGFVQWNPVYD